jgi:hypothetical protein
MLTVICGVDDLRAADLMTSQSRFNSEYFVNHAMAPMIAKAFPQRRTPRARQLHLQLDNCRVHSSKTTQQFMNENHILDVPHSPYSPDLAPADFWLFGHVKLRSLARGSRSQKNFSRPSRSF